MTLSPIFIVITCHAFFCHSCGFISAPEDELPECSFSGDPPPKFSNDTEKSKASDDETALRAGTYCNRFVHITSWAHNECGTLWSLT